MIFCFGKNNVGELSELLYNLGKNTKSFEKANFSIRPNQRKNGLFAKINRTNLIPYARQVSFALTGPNSGITGYFGLHENCNTYGVK